MEQVLADPPHQGEDRSVTGGVILDAKGARLEQVIADFVPILR